MRLGVFGGSFDPIHYGHLLLAECCRDACRLDRVWFVPAAEPPHKVRELRASGDQRTRMLQMALDDHPTFDICLTELERGGISYTVDTLAAIRKDHPRADLFLLMGADSLADLPTWHEPAEICRLSTPVIVRRPGAGDPNFAGLAGLIPEERIDEIRSNQFAMPWVELSSTEIRRRTAEGMTIRYQTPPDVSEFIRQHGLYRTS